MDRERSREQLRRAVEDGERLYRAGMRRDLTAKEDFRVSGLLTRELENALALADSLLAALAAAEAENARLREFYEAWRALTDTGHHYSRADDSVFGRWTKALADVEAALASRPGEGAA